MYLGGFERLDRAGYDQYEISNVARSGFASRHNVKYWQGGDWRGFGCGAHSTVDGRRWRNVSSTADYVDRIDRGADPGADVHDMTWDERIEEALFTGLRLSAGIDEGNFRVRYGVDPWTRYGATLEPCVEEGLMWRGERTFGLTRRGMLVANEILAAFV
jgi:oxygen-independent coproporphyrinogen-3 oxidase